MKVPEFRLIMKTDPPARGDPGWVRGFFANLFSGNPLFGNHSPTGGNLYLFPRVQYRVADGCLVVMGVAEGAEAVEAIAISPRTLRLGRREVQVIDIQRRGTEVDVGLGPRVVKYRFVRPWMPLNQENHSKFLAANTLTEQRDLLERIMIGNLLTLAKGVGETVVGTIRIADLKVQPRTCQVKGQSMLVFDGRFSTNFRIPDDWAIGRGGSRGFGVVRKALEAP